MGAAACPVDGHQMRPNRFSWARCGTVMYTGMRICPRCREKTAALAAALMESWPRGRRRTIGNRVCGVEPYLEFESLALRHLSISVALRGHVHRTKLYSKIGCLPRCPTSRRGGRVVECGGLENRLAGAPRHQGSNPCLSARTTRCHLSTDRWHFL